VPDQAPAFSFQPVPENNMGLKLTQKPTFTATVEIDIANDKGGFERNVIKATFKRANTDEAKALAELELNADVIRAQLVGFSGLLDDNGSEVPFTEENVEALLQIPATLKPLATAFWNGNSGAKAKNG
jgi:hypothetical protein